MKLNKDYGVYLEVQNIEDKNDKYMFTELLNAVLESKFMQYDSDGWYYPGERSKGQYESCIAFAFTVVTKFKQFHKYINQLLVTKRGGLYDDWKGDAIKINEW